MDRVYRKEVQTADSEPIHPSRRRFLRQAAAAVGVLAFGARAADEVVELPFDNGARPLVRYPQKRPLLRLTTRPPQLETPFAVFNEGVLTPNDAFFVRYHLTKSPPPAAELQPERFRLAIKGAVERPLSLSVEELRSRFERVEVVAVNQCSGNSRGFFEPRVVGGQSGHGNMGNARWTGVRLADVLKQAGLRPGARQVTFNGLDAPLLSATPDFVKALEADHALDGEALLAWAMNGEDLPWLNGYPLRLVVPGHFGTYWIKHLHEIEVLDREFDGWWMSTAYRIPDNDCACVEPGGKPDRTRPIGRFNVRSFITNVADGDRLPAGQPVALSGIAFDGGRGIRSVEWSRDGGQTWQPAALGDDLGRYSFREWKAEFTPAAAGGFTLQCRATTHGGETQPAAPRWNPAGYMRNVIESVRVTIT